MYGGVPAKRIKSFEDFVEKRKCYHNDNSKESLWKLFDNEHKITGSE